MTKAQRVLISLLLITSIILAGENDDVLETVDYGTIYKAVTDSMNGSKYSTLDAFAREAAGINFKTEGGKYVYTTIVLPKALLQAADVVLSVKDLKLPCVIDLNSHERQAKQLLLVNLRF